jgi:nucleoid-associated protein YgaU
MNDPMDLILAPTVTPTNAFPASSRYSGGATATMELPDGRSVIYLRRRFIPSASRLTTRQEHTVVQGDRLDNLSAQFLGDPLLFWRIADANNAMRAEALTEKPGRVLRIAFPEAVFAPLS